MVRVRGPLQSFLASKQLGKALIFKTKKGRCFVTNYSKPGRKNPFTASAEQTTMRGYMQDGRDAWGALSDADKQAWNDFVIPKHGQ